MHSLTNCFSSDISADSIRCPIAYCQTPNLSLSLSLSLSRFWKVIELWRTFWNWTFCFLFVWEMENWDFMRVSNVAFDGSHCQSFDVKDKRWWWWWRWRCIYCLVTWESTILRMGLIYHITIVTLPLNLFAGTDRFSDGPVCRYHTNNFIWKEFKIEFLSNKIIPVYLSKKKIPV